MRNKIIIGILAFLAFLLFTVIFTLIMFPMDSVKSFVEKTAEKALKQSHSVEIQKMNLGIIDLTAQNIKAVPRNIEENADMDAEGKMIDGYYCLPSVGGDPIIINKVYIKPALTTLSGPHPEASFNVEVANGKIDGKLGMDGEDYRLKMEAGEIALQAFSLLSNVTKTQFYGTLGVDANVVLGDNKMPSGGNIDLTIGNAVMCPKPVDIIPGFSLPLTVFGNITAGIVIENKNIKITKLISTGPDMRISGKGDIRLSDKGGKPTLNLDVTILPSEEWLTANSMESIYSFCRRQDDGSVLVKLRGSADAPRTDCGKPVAQPVKVQPTVEKKETPKPETKANAEPEKKAEPAKKKDENRGTAQEHTMNRRARNTDPEPPSGGGGRRGVPARLEDMTNGGEVPPRPGARHNINRPGMDDGAITRLRPDALKSLEEEDQKAWEGTIGRRGQRQPPGRRGE